MAIMSRLVQEKSINPRIGQLLDELQAYGESLPYDSDDAAMLRATRREYERNIKVPPTFVAELTEHQPTSYQTWAEARPENDWPRVVDGLVKTLDYSRRLANFFPGYDHIADPLIDFADYGMKADDVRKIFADLRSELVPIIQQIMSQEPADDSVLKQHYPKGEQLSFSESVKGGD